MNILFFNACTCGGKLRPFCEMCGKPADVNVKNRNLCGKCFDENYFKREQLCADCGMPTPEEHFIAPVGLCDGCENKMSEKLIGE